MKKMTAVFLCLMLLAAPSAHAGKKGGQPQNIDFGSFTCQQFIDEFAQGSAEDIGVVMMWIDGYLSGVSGDTELNWKEFESFSTALAEYCSTHGKTNLLEAAKKKGIQ